MQWMMCFAPPQFLNHITYPMTSLQNLYIYLLFNIPSISWSCFNLDQYDFYATFNIVLGPYYQCLIIIVFDMQLLVFIPVVCVVSRLQSDGKPSTGLDQLLTQLLLPLLLLESAFDVQVVDYFIETKIISCLSHFKQAINRRLIKLVFSIKQRSFQWEIHYGCDNCNPKRWYKYIEGKLHCCNDLWLLSWVVWKEYC